MELLRVYRWKKNIIFIIINYYRFFPGTQITYYQFFPGTQLTYYLFFPGTQLTYYLIFPGTQFTELGSFGTQFTNPEILSVMNVILRGRDTRICCLRLISA